jgi:hypothetical protein
LDDGLDVKVGKGNCGQHRDQNDLRSHALHLIPSLLLYTVGVAIAAGSPARDQMKPASWILTRFRSARMDSMVVPKLPSLIVALPVTTGIETLSKQRMGIPPGRKSSPPA